MIVIEPPGLGLRDLPGGPVEQPDSEPVFKISYTIAGNRWGQPKIPPARCNAAELDGANEDPDTVQIGHGCL